MRIILAPVALSASILIGADPKHTFVSGKLLDIGSTERVVGGTVHRSAEFTVQVADLIYTARGDRIGRGSGDVGKGLIVGDPVQVVIDGEHLIFLKPDGKEMKTIITKRTRVQATC